MATIIKRGDDASTTLPWYRTVIFTCSACQTEFQLDDNDAPLSWAQVTDDTMSGTFASVEPVAHISLACPACHVTVVALNNGQWPSAEPIYVTPSIRVEPEV